MRNIFIFITASLGLVSEVPEVVAACFFLCLGASLSKREFKALKSTKNTKN